MVSVDRLTKFGLEMLVDFFEYEINDESELEKFRDNICVVYLCGRNLLEYSRDDQHRGIMCEVFDLAITYGVNIREMYEEITREGIGIFKDHHTNKFYRIFSYGKIENQEIGYIISRRCSVPK